MTALVGFVCVLFALKLIKGEDVGDLCTLKSTGTREECKLLKDCQIALQDFLLKKSFPQTCGFQGTQPIVCCPESFGQMEFPTTTASTPKKKPGKNSIQGDLCTLKSTGTREECKLLKDCQIALQDLLQKKRFPQTCGFQGTQPIVCCPESFGQVQFAAATMTTNTTTTSEKSTASKPNVKPEEISFQDDQTIITGWGKTECTGDSRGDLLIVTLDLFSYEKYNYSYINQINMKLKRGIVDDLQLCAATENEDEEKDICQADSGGPLQIGHTGDDIKCMYDVIGVTSFGKPCSGSPGVYTIVSTYLQWIKDAVWP